MKLRNRLLTRGDYAPWFQAAALSGSNSYAFSAAAGRHVLMLFFGSASFEACSSALALVDRNRALFDDAGAAFFGVTVNPEDVALGRVRQQLPGIRFFQDYDKKVSRLYGASLPDGYAPHWLVLDKELRIAGVFPLRNGEEAISFLTAQINKADEAWAPVIRVPDVFEPELCRKLVDLYETEGGHESGFMRDVNGRTVGIIDGRVKRRKDYNIEGRELQRALVARLHRKLVPAIKRAFQFEATRIERYIVACYDADGGYFRPHRDNTTLATAHRKFAVTINLNEQDYEGGDLRFPEFGNRTYRAPTGGAVVFSCSLLHEATPVTQGRRYAFLPFLYDDAAARVREENSRFLGEAPADTEAKTAAG